MKNYFLLFLLLTFSVQAQTLPSPAYNNTTTNTLKIKTPATVTSVNFLPTMEADFSLAKIDPVLLPLSTATINAINVQDATAVHKTGNETIQDKKTFTLSSLTEAEAAVTIKREYPGVATNKVATLNLVNEGEVPGSQGYQNEVNIFLKAGITQNWRRYLGFLNFDNSIAWLTGSNAFNDWILYDSSKTKHNILIQGTTGDFFINSVGAIKMNSDPLATSSSQGLEIYDGTIGQTVPTWKFTGSGAIQKSGNNLYVNPLVSGSIGASGTLLFSSGTTTSPVWGQSSSLDFSLGGLTAKKNVTNYFVPQITGVSVSEPNKKINLGLNTSTNIGYLQAVNEGVTVLPIAINPNGGRVIFGKSTDNGVDSGQFNSTVSGSAATLSNQFVIKSQLDLKADLASPTFTGDPKVPTATAGDSDTSAANTLFVQTAIASIDIQDIVNATTKTGIIDSGNSQVSILDGSVNNRTFSVTVSPATGGSNLNLQNTNVSLLNEITGVGSGGFIVNSSIPTIIRSKQGVGTTSISVEEPIGNSDINFQALPAGSYQVSVAKTYSDSTTVVKTSSTLTTDYPSALPGDKVHALSIIAGALIYEKTATGWAHYPVTVTP